MVCFPYERRRGGRISPSMRRFSEVSSVLGLIDIPLKGVLLLGGEGATITRSPNLTSFWFQMIRRATLIVLLCLDHFLIIVRFCLTPVGFKVALSRSVLKSCGLGPFFPFHILWNPWVPTKMSFFAWEAS